MTDRAPCVGGSWCGCVVDFSFDMEMIRLPKRGVTALACESPRRGLSLAAVESELYRLETITFGRTPQGAKRYRFWVAQGLTMGEAFDILMKAFGSEAP